MLRGLLLLSLAVLSCLQAFAQEEAPSGMKLFLLIGQSNMAGRGIVEEQDRQTDPRIFMLTKERTWVLAKDPVHFDKPNIAGVGLCSQFARDISKAWPDARIGLIPCAVGGTSLKQWTPGGELYVNAVERARYAMGSGTLCGILWHQGEADSGGSNKDSYPERFASMIGSLRKDIGAENVPLVIGELGPYKPSYVKFNEVLPRIPETVPLCALVRSEGLTANADNVHFNAASLRTFGSRYAEVFLKLQSGAASSGK